MAEEPEKVSCSSSALHQPCSGDKRPGDAGGIKPQAHPHGDSPLYEEHMNRGAGIYAIPVHQYSALPSNYLIPLTYNVPTTRPGNETATATATGVGAENPAQGQPHPRQVVERRFQIAFQLDLFLIVKLAAVIFLFNQDGSRQRLAVLVIFATIIYLYQTGALAPFVRWLSQGMHRAAVPPPRPQRPAPRADNDPAAVPLNEEGQENEAANGNPAIANENENVNAGQQGNQWWGIVKEIQMIVFGFITSLLPGFHNIE